MSSKKKNRRRVLMIESESSSKNPHISNFHFLFYHFRESILSNQQQECIGIYQPKKTCELKIKLLDLQNPKM